MKSIRKHFQQAGNIVLIQIKTLEGAVNTLLAINGSDHFCLLTDMDLLKGAKQNRVVNTSVLLAPNSKQEIKVSCVERSRWSYDSPNFKTAPGIMDPEMRAAKAASLREDTESMVSETQSKIWDLINQEMTSSNVFCSTEDYNAVLESKKKEQVTGYRFHPGKSYNGLAIFDGRRLVSFDIFGNREVYAYYFDKLSHDALGRAGQGRGSSAMKKAEAFYRLDEFLDAFESKLDSPITRVNGNIGEFRWSGDQDYPGFELSFENRPVHMVGFSR